jgi:hypothetical protein
MFLPSSGSAQESRVRQFKAFGQFENRYVRDVRISFVMENLFQKKYVLEYSSGHCFFVTPNHKHLRIAQKKGAPSFYRRAPLLN